MNSLQQIASVLKESDNILIFPHVNIDGDAFGSSSALCAALRLMGKNAYIMMSEDAPSNLDYLEHDYITRDASVLEKTEIALMLDCNGYDRIRGREEEYKAGRIKICIDHHATANSEIEYDYYHCEPQSAATAELVYLLIKELGVEINLEIAESIFTGITTDTGNFQHSNTTKRTHMIAAELYDIKGFGSKKISSLIYDRRSRDEFTLENIVLSNLTFYADGKIAVGTVTQDLLDTLGCNLSHADPIIQRVMSINGVEIGAIIKQNPEGFFKASLRAKSYANVAEVAAQFGGGGHVRAAGCNLGENIGEAKFKLIDALTKAVNV